MGIFGKVRMAWRGWRAWRKGKKMGEQVCNALLEPTAENGSSGVLKGAASSSTTQNVLMASAGSLATVGAIVQLIATFVPGASDYLTPETKQALIVVIGGLVIPFASRGIAFFRHPEKRTILVGSDPPALPMGMDLLTVVRIQTATGNAWEEFDGLFEAAVAVGAGLIHCSNENVYRANGELVCHMALPGSMRGKGEG